MSWSRLDAWGVRSLFLESIFVEELHVTSTACVCFVCVRGVYDRVLVQKRRWRGPPPSRIVVLGGCVGTMGVACHVGHGDHFSHVRHGNHVFCARQFHQVRHVRHAGRIYLPNDLAPPKQNVWISAIQRKAITMKNSWRAAYVLAQHVD